MNLLQQLQQATKDDQRQARWRAHLAICQSKLRFSTKQLARRWCRRVVSRGGDPRIRPYQCRVCGLFHTTVNRERSTVNGGTKNFPAKEADQHKEQQCSAQRPNGRPGGRPIRPEAENEGDDV